MAVVIPGPPVLARDLTLFHTTDPLLSNASVLIFHGSSSTLGSTSSRIQVHIFTPAGPASYPRLAVSPNSPFYSAVSNLPRDEQGDEIIRGIAFALKKYFAELPQNVRDVWCSQAKAPVPSKLFGDDHIAILASRMTRIENLDEVADIVEHAFAEQRQSWEDVDVVLPPGTIKESSRTSGSLDANGVDSLASMQSRYENYTAVVAALGDTTFLPTSRLKRAPSKASTIGRSASFLRQQKENARRELRELAETEANYVERLRELSGVAVNADTDLDQLAQAQLRRIFPTTISQIFEANSGLCVALWNIIDSSEDVSMQDIESTPKSDQANMPEAQDTSVDSHGISAVAECLCEWLPRLSAPYGAYLESHAVATQSLRELLRSGDTARATQLQAVGEQKLTSLLIEPVQRLPRYTLYIDSIVKQLPTRHPAIKPFLKARDIITEICSQNEDAVLDQARTITKLRQNVLDWPSGFDVNGRLVAIVDVQEMQPPFDLVHAESFSCLLLLFTDNLLLLRKTPEHVITARSMLTELESALPSSWEGTASSRASLRFVDSVTISTSQCTESHHGRVVHILGTRPFSSTDEGLQSAATLLTLRLEGSYDGKAAKLSEEIRKARIEGRYSEAERESHGWELRASDPAADHASLLSAIIQDSNYEHVRGRAGCATTRILVDIDKHSHRPRAGQDGIRTVAALSPTRDGRWRLTIDSIDGPASQEHVSLPELALVLSRRLTTLAQTCFAVAHESAASCRLVHNALVLENIDLEVQLDPEAAEPRAVKDRPKRPRSPVKLLSNLLSSTTQQPVTLKKDACVLAPPTLMQRSASIISKPPSRESRPTSRDNGTPKSLISVYAFLAADGNNTEKLEKTLSAFIIALQARKGNVVGRSLNMRGSADELAVNELYNSLLEDPNTIGLAAQASVDVLFAAFEKFLNIAWKDAVGSILPSTWLQDIQTKAQTLFPSEFDEHLRKSLSRLAPHSQRAFKSVMRLLADLLDGTGNDGDRGLLTAAFAEALVPGDDARNFIPLIDRFVDDTETYFGEPIESVKPVTTRPQNAHKRSRSVNSASLTSNTSSLRKKFGLSTIGRASSKADDESKVSAVWRTLSKSSRSDGSPAGSLTRASFYRSLSTDIDTSLLNRSEEASFDDSLGQTVLLKTIGEHPSFIPTSPPRKKRRSSLSDIKALESVTPRQALTPPRRPALHAHSSEETSWLRSQLPSTPTLDSGDGLSLSPSKHSARSRLPSSFRRERETSERSLQAVQCDEKKENRKIEENPQGSKAHTSAIPTLSPRLPSSLKSVTPGVARYGLSEHPGAGNIIKKPTLSPTKIGTPKMSNGTDSGSPRKLRMQSPQKLRERLQNEQGALHAAHATLQEELSVLEDEIGSAPSHAVGSLRMPKTTNGHSRGNSQGRHSIELAQRVLRMEGTLSKLFDSTSSTIDQIRSDVSTSLSVSEAKCKKLDDLYREANGENEALYGRFNDELGRILKAVKGGEGIEELKTKLKESQEDAAKLRREVSRLKRENVGLRAQMRD